MSARTRRRDEHGQITVMMLGLAVVLLLVIAAVADLSAGHLRQETARSYADGAALAAADGAAAPAGYAGGGAYVALDPAVAARSVDAYFRDTRAAAKYPGMTWTVAVEDEQVTVGVRLPYDFPITMPGFAAGSYVHASGTAVVPVY